MKIINYFSFNLSNINQLFPPHSLFLPTEPPVGGGDSVEVGLLAIVDICVRFPNLPQHLYTQGQGVLCQNTDTDTEFEFLNQTQQVDLEIIVFLI